MDSRRKTPEGVSNAVGVARVPRTAVWSQTFGEAGNEDCGQLSPEQRTLSWVSSAFSATESLTVADVSASGSKGQTADREPGIDGVDNINTSLTRRQHVRLTTIDPITGSIAYPNSTASVDELYSPGPAPGAFSLEDDDNDNDELCCQGQARETAQHSLLAQPHLVAHGCETDAAGVLSDNFVLGQGKGASGSGLESHVANHRAAPRAFMRKDQRLVEKKTSSTKRLSRAATSRAVFERLGDEIHAVSVSETSDPPLKLDTAPRISAHPHRRTMGVGGTGTSTLGLSYSNTNLFPIKARQGSQRKPAKGTPATGTAAAPPTSTASSLLRAPAKEPAPVTAITTSTSSAETSAVREPAPAATKPALTRVYTLSSSARVGLKSSSSSLSREPATKPSPGKKPLSLTNSKRAQQAVANKADTMSRATASNYLNPHLRRRSRSGVFESSPSSSSTGGGTAPVTPIINSAANAATISGTSKARLGMTRPGMTADRQYLQRPAYTNAGSGTDDERSAVLATSAAAGAAGRPRRMTHQATRLTIDPERAKAAAGTDMPRRTPVTATGVGSSAARRFLRTPSNQELQQVRTDAQPHSPGKDGPDGFVPRPRIGGAAAQARTTAQQAGTHRPLQAKLETSSGPNTVVPRSAARPPIGAPTGAKPPTWRTQQAVRETDDRMSSTGNSTPQRTPANYTGISGTKMAVREGNGQSSSSRGKTSDESKDDSDSKPNHLQRLRPVQSKPTQINAGRHQSSMQSSASAIGIGSYNAAYQAPRPAHRAGAAASVVGAIAPSQVAAPLQTHAAIGQGVRPQIGSYQPRYVAQKGPSSVVSAAPAPTQQQQQMMHIHFPVKPVADQALQQQPRPPTAPGMAAQSRSQSAAHTQSRLGERTPEGASLGGVPPLTPQEAVARYGHQLSAQERTEILEFPHIYYVGNAKARVATRSNYGFDDERGDYIIHMHDHMLYRYELQEVMGKGSFGQVLRACDHKTGETVAIKIIRNRKRFHHQAQVEVKLLECLRRWDPSGAHNILQMTASFYFRNHLCIVMELLSINLYEWLKAHQFSGTPVPLLRSFTVQMLQSLQLMARHRIIHADLKPENILLAHPPPMPSRRVAPPGASGPPPHPLSNPQLGADIQRGAYQIKVIDLGSSCFETERVYTYIQSRFYRAPEVILGLPYGTGIDVWSLGCIVVELLTGYPLFPGENEREQLATIVEVLGPPPAYMLERAPRCADFAEPAPYGVQATPTGNMLLLPNGACLVGNLVIKPFSNSKGKRRRPGSRPLVQILARARDPRLVDFVLRTLAWDPAMRMSPEDALCHPWINDMPAQRPNAGIAPPPHAHLGAQQSPGYMMSPGGYIPQQQQQQQQHMASQNNYMQQMPQHQAGYGNMARARKA
ncbi:serine/threonine protein kinase, CMGC, dual-specificity [Coemansia aciculifera]|nr:serine/threonine protein kinase, CMGC, dual-specificity [Coemansia aciculifera]